MQIGHGDAYKSVHLVEHELEFRILHIKQLTDTKLADYRFHYRECQSFVSHAEEQEAGNEVHALTVVEVGVHDGVGVQNIC